MPPWFPSALERGGVWERLWLGTRCCSSLSVSYRDSPSYLLLGDLDLTLRIIMSESPEYLDTFMLELRRIKLNTKSSSCLKLFEGNLVQVENVAWRNLTMCISNKYT